MAITRRNLLISGGVGVGLVVAWAAWPRAYRATLPAAPGETVFGPFLKIARDGQVIVAVPQAETGQGITTALAQIVADELGADWRTVGVEAAPVSPLYANPLAADALFAGAFDRVPEGVREEHWTRSALMLTAASTGVRRFEAPLREAGAAARVLLCKAAAARWDADWQACDTADGFVTMGGRRLRFGELAEAAAAETLPDELPLRIGDEGRLTGRSLPRIDVPAKVDGSANFTADIRLPDMVFASIRQGPTPASRLLSCDKRAAERVRGMVSVVETAHWVAAVANNWWAANRGLAALAPRFATDGPLPADPDAALEAALAGEGWRAASEGDVGAAFRGARLIRAEYAVAPALHAAIETPAATAQYEDGRLELWIATEAPGIAQAAAAEAAGLSTTQVIVHPMLVGGGFGAALEPAVARQAAILAQRLRRPVQLTWSRGEALMHQPVRAPARARMTARLAPNGQILGWHAAIAAPASGRALAARLLAHDPLARVARALPDGADGHAVAGARPGYRIPAIAIDHHPADLPLAIGHLRGGAHGYTAFFTECFVDELAHVAQSEPVSYRIGMLGGDARMARCLSTVSALGGWEGGMVGSGQGIACHTMAGSCIAVLAEVHQGEDGRVAIDRLVAAVDCGRAINPDGVRQQVEGGLVFGAALATGCTTGYAEGLATTRLMSAVRLPTLATAPEVTVELIPSTADPGGVGDLGVVAVAPAVANALRAATGTRVRTLPLSAR
ncbi:molybdopterin cofactor-binding domain-containing protein [Sphingomonas corticis]|jgi:isoquinoline 1-oxidoreductase beta subunit|uniref:Molybdopterin-dependent oxidoreductase n=1 Tax=Sphingomonas corticis TaxID=2722791 RepID=A0ABX1CL41_9SPHN|nr:molybdopterin cofactor-binding domain-containing protein [Sphingomonas corticis]NJR78679.1 molybdopterin-dependent oxidoreductase [Sphingomonas corticis]